MHMTEHRSNVVATLEDALQSHSYQARVGKVDCVCANLGRQDQSSIVKANADLFLKSGGWVVVTMDASIIGPTVSPECVFDVEVDKMRRYHFRPSEQLTLEPHF